MATEGDTEQAERLAREADELLELAKRLDARDKAPDQKADRPSFDEQADRPGIDTEFRKLKERHQDLLAKERAMRETNASEEEFAVVRRLIGQTSRELEKIHAYLTGRGENTVEHEQAEKLEIAGRRIHHLRVAAENLMLAEERDLARQLMDQAEALERDVQAAKEQEVQAALERLAGEIQEFQEHQGHHEPDWVQELRDEIKQLRAEVKELSQKIEER